MKRTNGENACAQGGKGHQLQNVASQKRRRTLFLQSSSAPASMSRRAHAVWPFPTAYMSALRLDWYGWQPCACGGDERNMTTSVSNYGIKRGKHQSMQMYSTSSFALGSALPPKNEFSSAFFIPARSPFSAEKRSFSFFELKIDDMLIINRS